MKLACSSSSYHAAFRAGRLEQREWIRLCADTLDVDGVELTDVHFPTTDRGYLRDLKRECVERGLTIAGLAVTNDFGSEDHRQQEIEGVRQWCDVAAFIGAPVVRVFAGAPAVAPQVPDADEGRIVGAFRKVFGQTQPNVRRAWSDAAYALRQCADHAAERAVVLAAQNRAKSTVASQADLAQCVRDVGSSWLRICLDPAALPEALNSSFSNVVAVRASMREVREDGSDARTAWPDVLRRLRGGGYRGFIVLEYEGDSEPEGRVPAAAKYLRAAMLAATTPGLAPVRAGANGSGENSPAVQDTGTSAGASDPR